MQLHAVGKKSNHIPLGVSMQRIEQTIEVSVPIKRAYNQWTQFEDFPQFMEGVKEVRQIDDKRVHWLAEIGGKEVVWEAEITQQIPEERIGWRSTSGAENAGHVSFVTLGPERTRITLSIAYDPKGLVEKAGNV